VTRFVSLGILAAVRRADRNVLVHDPMELRRFRGDPDDDASEHELAAGLPTPPPMPIARRVRD